MRVALSWLLMGLGLAVAAKQPTLYHCQQADGRVVIQDRRCVITQLPEAKPEPRPNHRLTPSGTPKVSNHKQPSSNKTNRLAATRQYASPPKPSHQRQSRSPYFAAEWASFFPNHWQKLRIQTQQHEQWLISQQAFKGLGDFRQGVRLAVYANTLRNQRQGAFALALQLYQKIRDNQQITLLDSQYKSHPNFKVFNVKYFNQNRDLAVTEYYIDDRHHDLFVLTIQAPEHSWSAQWQLAEHIISQL